MTSTPRTVRPKSQSLYRRALDVLPGGASRNAVLRQPHPIYSATAAGCRVIDVDGFEYIDFSNNMTALIHGHSHPQVVADVTDQLAKGTAYNLATEVEIEFAEHMQQRNPSFESIRFVNSGTEAVMVAIKTARAHTGRSTIAKVEGAYHGTYDYAEVSQTSDPSNWGSPTAPESVPVVSGTPQGVLDDVVVIPFNSIESTLDILDRWQSKLACVLIDPMPHRAGLVPASDEYVSAIRNWTHDDGSLLVFDEVITFRSEYGGAQTWYESVPDLTALGKIIGGGFPIGAVTGRREVMDVFDPRTGKALFPHSGTFSGNPVSMRAGLTAMQLFTSDEVKRLNELAKSATTGIEKAIADLGTPACVSGRGSLFRVHLTDTQPADYRATYATSAGGTARDALLAHLLKSGHLLIDTVTAALSTPMGRGEIDSLVSSISVALKQSSQVK